MELRYWRGIHSEFMTHRVFSRNARSSRAVPVPRLIEEVATNPFVPKHWGANQKGMQAGAECNELVPFEIGYSHLDSSICYDRFPREKAWLKARDEAVKHAQAFHDAGYHKQIVNRILEPFMFIDVLVTSTEWSNFFALRDDPMAEPHIRDLAVEMKEVMAASTPQFLHPGQWHLPYVGSMLDAPTADHAAMGEWGAVNGRTWTETARAVSVTRCARISYTPFHGESGDIAAEVARHDQLVSARPMHASPCEHQATPDIRRGVAGVDGWDHPNLHGNLRGWQQYRKMISGENVTR
jgi:thymidylate synthase ThyX